MLAKLKENVCVCIEKEWKFAQYMLQQTLIIGEIWISYIHNFYVRRSSFLIEKVDKDMLYTHILPLLLLVLHITPGLNQFQSRWLTLTVYRAHNFVFKNICLIILDIQCRYKNIIVWTRLRKKWWLRRIRRSKKCLSIGPSWKNAHQQKLLNKWFSIYYVYLDKYLSREQIIILVT